MSTSDLEEYFRERIEEYEDLNAHDTTRDDFFLIDCPGECGRPMLLGPGWRGMAPPACIECNDTADTWTKDVRISEDEAEALKTDEANVRELVTS